MSLPISPRRRKGSSGDDVALAGWAIIVARVAWTLHYRKISPAEIMLKTAVEHAIMNIKPDTTLISAEDLSEHYVHQLINRYQRIDSKPVHPQDIHIPLKESWRQSLNSSLSSLQLGVLRYLYGNRYTINETAGKVGLDPYAIPAVQEAIREKLVEIANDDHFPMEAWQDDRVDGFLYRLVGVPPEPCPTNLQAVHQDNHQHRKICCRCDRVASLLVENCITPNDLVPPPFGARPLDVTTILAIQIKDESKHHRTLLEKESVTTFTASPDVLLFDFGNPDSVQRVLKLATELGKPAKNHLRGVVLKGDGKWTDSGLIGPLTNEAVAKVSTGRWGIVEQITDLANRHDTPPSAIRAWAAALAVLILALAASWIAFNPQPNQPLYPFLDMEYVKGQNGIWATFDVEDAALVSIFVEKDGVLMDILYSTEPAQKMALSTGDGLFSIQLDTDAILIVSSKEPLKISKETLTELSQENGIKNLADQIGDRYPLSALSLYMR